MDVSQSNYRVVVSKLNELTNVGVVSLILSGFSKFIYYTE